MKCVFIGLIELFGCCSFGGTGVFGCCVMIYVLRDDECLRNELWYVYAFLLEFFGQAEKIGFVYQFVVLYVVEIHMTVCSVCITYKLVILETLIVSPFQSILLTMLPKTFPSPGSQDLTHNLIFLIDNKPPNIPGNKFLPTFNCIKLWGRWFRFLRNQTDMTLFIMFVYIGSTRDSLFSYFLLLTYTLFVA